MKRYLFFLRHYNDIDNIAPVIYFFLKKNNAHRADVILYHERYDFRKNPNLLFLQEHFGDRFSYKWLGDYFDIDTEKHFRSFQSKNNIKQLLLRIASIFFSQKTLGAVKRFIVGDKKLARVRKVTVTNIRFGRISQSIIENGIKKILLDHGLPSLIAFDINRTSHIQGLLDALRSLGVSRIICLPVSPLINYNVLRMDEFVNVFSEEFVLHHDYSGVDALGYVGHCFTDSYNQFFSSIGKRSSLKGKTTSLGSIRYCPEWLAIQEKMISPYRMKSDKVKIVFFPSHPKSNVNWDEVERTLEVFSLFPEYEIVVKHHTRDITKKKKRVFSNITFDEHAVSSSLINWADVVIFWSTSVAIEGYLKNKTMVCLSYISGNNNLYEKYNAGYIAHCRDDLIFFLVKYKTDKSSIGYCQDGVDSFIQDIVYSQKKSVPEEYLKFMEKNECALSLS